MSTPEPSKTYTPDQLPSNQMEIFDYIVQDSDGDESNGDDMTSYEQSDESDGILMIVIRLTDLIPELIIHISDYLDITDYHNLGYVNKKFWRVLQQ